MTGEKTTMSRHDLIEKKTEQNYKIIDDLNLNDCRSYLEKLNSMRNLVRAVLVENADYGVIPGCKKPTLLKPGAEKIVSMMGLTTEFNIENEIKDYDKGYFFYSIKCVVYKGNFKVTEGLGTCNTKENKYIKNDPYTLDNTILKMAKKRALIDAVLLVASLSEIFTQDVEDMNFERGNYSNNHSSQPNRQYKQSNNYRTEEQTYTEGHMQPIEINSNEIISKQQAKQVYAMCQNDLKLLNYILEKCNCKSTFELTVKQYENVVNYLKKQA